MPRGGDASTVTWQLASFAVLALALAAGFGWYERAHPSSKVLALVATLAALAALGRVAFAPLPNVKPITDIVLFSGTSLSFNIAHAVGNVVFCLAFGPAFVRALLRFRERFEIRWEPVAASALAVAALVAVPATARAATPTAYLVAAQNRDGGFGAARGQPSNQLYSAWAAMGLAAAGRHDARVARYLAAAAPRIRDVGDVERTILGLVAQGASPRRDLVARLLRARRRDGSWEGLVNRTAFGILALRAARTGDAQVRAATRWLGHEGNRDGGFAFSGRGATSGIDDTAGVVQALAAAGHRRGRTVRRAVSFLAAHQNPDGGFPLQPHGPSNAQSTAWAIQAFVAAGSAPDRVRRGGSRSPLAYLRSLTAGDGSVRYSRTSRQTPGWGTAQALTALNRRAFPIAPR